MRVIEFTPKELAHLERVRAICLGLPDAEEALKWGHPNFLARGKIFCGFGREGGVAAVGMKTTPRRQAELVATGRYYVTPYVGRFGWISHPFAGRVRWKELESLIEESYLLVVPRRGRAPATRSRRRRSPGPARS
jgi:predicted DNA-binding protein (MmcQ/YjbR family)